jgi:hypothetical protein
MTPSICQCCKQCTENDQNYGEKHNKHNEMPFWFKRLHIINYSISKLAFLHFWSMLQVAVNISAWFSFPCPQNDILLWPTVLTECDRNKWLVQPRIKGWYKNSDATKEVTTSDSKSKSSRISSMPEWKLFSDWNQPISSLFLRQPELKTQKYLTFQIIEHPDGWNETILLRHLFS